MKSKFKNYFIILLFILIIATGLRLYKLDSKSVWYDEAKYIDHSLRKKLITIFFPKGYLTHSPLYLFILRIWGNILNQNVITLRLFSVTISIITVFMTYKIGDILYDKKIGLLSAFLLTISPFHIFYSQEIGNFVLFLFLVSLLIYIILKIFLNDKYNKSRLYFYFAVLNFLLLLTHYFSILLLISLDIFFFFQMKKYKNTILKLFLIQIIIFFILSLLILRTIINFNIEGFISVSWIPKRSFWNAVASMFETFSYGGHRYGGEDIFIPERYLIIPHILCFIYILIIIVGLIINIKNNFEKIFFLLLWLLGGLLLSFSYSYILFPIFVVRHLIFALPAFCILVAKGINDFKKKSFQYLMIMLISVINISPLSYYFNNELKTPWKKVTNYLKDRGINKNDLIIFNPFYEAYVIFYNFDYDIKNISKGKLQIASLDLFKKLISQGISSHIALDKKQKYFYQSDVIDIFENKRIFLIQSRWAGSEDYRIFSFLSLAKNKFDELSYTPYDPVEVRNYFNNLFHKKEELCFDYKGIKHILSNNFKNIFYSCYGVYIGEFYVPDNSDMNLGVQ